MAFLSCNSCNWSQDDFWSLEGYNPFRQDIVDWWRENLFRDRIHLDVKLAERIVDSPPRDEDGPYVYGPQLVIYELQRCIDAIKGMHVRTDKEWQKVRDRWRCPACGSTNWNID